MPFTPQPTNNTPETKILDSTFNEIAENDIYLKERADLVDDRLGQSLNETDSVTFSTVNTGQGDNELYDMDQNVTTSSSVTFATVNTGQGNNELYDMNQNVTTSSNVTFNNVTANGTFSPDSSPTSGTWSTNTTIPRGVYNVVLDFGTGGLGTVSIKQDGNIMMRLDATFVASYGGALFSDGSTVTVEVANGGRVFYRKY